MFTGLIAETGTVKTVAHKGRGWRIVVSAGRILRGMKTGDSISVSGVCLTALDIKKSSFAADLAAETVARTSLSRLHPGAVVNLERPARAGSRLDGHIVQGHVDGVARLVSLKPLPGAQDWKLELELPDGLGRYVVAKGSIAIEGISLTVAAIKGHRVTIAIIPHTYQETNLRSLRKGAELNIEVDILAKYAEKSARRNQKDSISMERLLQAGF